MSEDMNRIIERVRKLLALANDEKATDGERDNALRMAANIMARYQIDQSTVDKSARDRNDPRGRNVYEGWYVEWCNSIRLNIARLFDCMYFTGGKINSTRGRHVFVGRLSACTTAMIMSDWIVKGALREAGRITRQTGSAAAGRSFGLGVSGQLRHRIDQILKKTAEDIKAETGTDLVVIRQSEQEENEAYVAENMKTTKGKTLRISNRFDKDYFIAGIAHGDKVNLSRQLDGMTTKGIANG